MREYKKGHIFNLNEGSAKVVKYIDYVDSYNMNESYHIYLCELNNELCIIRIYYDDWDCIDVPKFHEYINM